MKLKFKKINVWTIVKGHFETLVNANTHKAGLDDWVSFLVVPVLAAVLIFWFKDTISDGNLNIIITSLSIFVGLLINVVVLIFTLADKNNRDSAKVEVLQETITNICYTILISVVTIVFAFIVTLDTHVIKQIFSILIYFLTIHFFVTLLMIIKRMYMLFMNQIDRENTQ